MKTSLGQMDGKAWEKYCHKLLHLKYEDYQEVPDKFGGDLGIEGFTHSGIVVQCYSPDEDVAARELYEKQRNKITRDIGKLIKNAAAISKLGVEIITEWHFLTPDYKHKDLLSHCQKKQKEVQDKGLAGVAPDFVIYLKTDDAYQLERQKLIGAGLQKVHSIEAEPPTEEVDALLASENDIVLNIKHKLGNLQLPSSQSDRLVRDLVHGYVVGRSELQALNERSPDVYRSVIQLKASKEDQLGIAILSAQGEHRTVLKNVLDDYQEELTGDFSEILMSSLISKLSTEAIADWLGRCPLDFHGIGNN